MKRFTDTCKWDDKWFRRLKPTWKLVWLYCKDIADNAAVINLDEELAEFRIGARVHWEEFERIFDGIILPIYTPSGQRRYWIPSQIYEQCGNLNERCVPHRAIIKALDSWKLLDRYNDMICEMVADTESDDDQDVFPGFEGGSKVKKLSDEDVVLICERWNKVAKPKGLAEIVSVSGARKRHYLKRIKEFPAFWDVIEKEVPLLKPFACGKNESEWSITFNYCVESQDKFNKLREGAWRSVKLQKEQRLEESKKRREAKKREKAVQDYVEVLRELGDQYSESELLDSKRSFAREWGTEALQMVEDKLKERVA